MMAPKVKDGLLAVANAYRSLDVPKEDFFVPPIAVPYAEGPLPIDEIVRRLEWRLQKLNKSNSFNAVVFSSLPSIHQKRLEQINFLKRQLQLNELFSEVGQAEGLLNALMKRDPAISPAFMEKISGLKKSILEKVNS